MKTRIFWGILMIALAVALILSALGIGFGLPEDISIGEIILGLFCLSWAVSLCTRRRFTDLPIPLVCIVMIFESEIATTLGIESGDLAPWWLFVLVAILLTWGLRLLFSGRSHRRCRFGVNVSENGNHKESSFSGSAVHYFDCSEHFEGSVENNMGACSVYFTNQELYTGGSTLRVENNLGSLTVHVPGDWCVTTSIDNSLGSIKVDADLEGAGSKVLTLVGENNLGSIVIKKA